MLPISVYIHWPYCLSLCPYCDFNSHVANTINHKQWLDAYLLELDHFAQNLKNKEIKSIFFGGGTPSLMEPFVTEAIINKIASLGHLSDFCEITLEANPTSFETEKFKQFKSSGINRVSLGVQSFIEKDLKTLGRTHSSGDAINAIESAGKIFDRYSFDLIYARPHQAIESWQNELKFAMQLARDHISLYQLTIEKGTPFFNLFRSNELILPSNDLSAELYEWTNFFLKQHNYNRYEISNYARQGSECVHNLCYWNYREYIGIGPGAHSRIHNGSKVFGVMTYHKPDKWLESVSIHGHGVQNNMQLSKSEAIEEMLMMGTRLSAGISEKDLTKLLEVNFNEILNQDALKVFIDNGFVSLANGILKLSDNGLLMHSYLISRLIL